MIIFHLCTPNDHRPVMANESPRTEQQTFLQRTLQILLDDNTITADAANNMVTDLVQGRLDPMPPGNAHFALRLDITHSWETGVDDEGRILVRQRAETTAQLWRLQ
jgi:hypothetical protein